MREERKEWDEMYQNLDDTAVEAKYDLALHDKSVFVKGKVIKTLPPEKSCDDPPKFIIKDYNDNTFMVIDLFNQGVNVDDEVVTKGSMYIYEINSTPTICADIIRQLK